MAEADSLALAQADSLLTSDSTTVASSTDTTAVAMAPTADSTTADTTAHPKVVTETGTYGDDYVYVGETVESDPLDSLLEKVPHDTLIGEFYVKDEPAYFDSIPPPLPSGEYAVKKYKTKFTADYMGGGFNYDTFFGLRGQTYFVFSDYLGNHQIYVATDLVNTIDQVHSPRIERHAGIYRSEISRL
jgi:hypothetical protein